MASRQDQQAEVGGSLLLLGQGDIDNLLIRNVFVTLKHGNSTGIVWEVRDYRS